MNKLSRSLPRFESALIDANLLLLLAGGLGNPRSIANHKRLATFSVGDFLALRDFLAGFRRVVATTHVLAEVSNLAALTNEKLRQAVMLQLSILFPNLQESTPLAINMCSLPEFRIFGLTDCGLASLASDSLLVYEDSRLSAFLNQRGMCAICLADLRG